MFDAELYRDKSEVEDWKHRDPIVLLRAALEADGVLVSADVEEMESEAARTISEAVAVAEAGHWEPVEDLTRDVYTETVEATP